MSLLLDTHVFLWWRGDRPRLSKRAQAAIANTAGVFVSLVSAWEISIKVAAGKLGAIGPIEAGIEESNFEKLPITFQHAERIASLPPHHGDPFDRMLIVQAMTEKLTVVTHDRRFEAYGIPILWT